MATHGHLQSMVGAQAYDSLGKGWESARAEGISVYDNLDYALERARRNRTGRGRLVVAIVVPDDGSVEVAKTMRNRHHYTIYASAERTLELVRGEPIQAISPNED
jgi:hypothetical protein